MIAPKTVSDKEWVYTVSLDMDREQLRLFYSTMARAYKSWPGGNPEEQELLKGIRDHAWKLLLEAQFKG